MGGTDRYSCLTPRQPTRGTSAPRPLSDHASAISFFKVFILFFQVSTLKTGATASAVVYWLFKSCGFSVSCRKNNDAGSDDSV